MNENIAAALKVAPLRNFLSLKIKNDEVQFQQNERSRIYLKESNLRFNLNQIYDIDSEIFVGDRVVIHSQLESIWGAFDINKVNSVSGPYFVIAFVSLRGYSNKTIDVQFDATFCILSKSLDFDSSNLSPFVTTGEDNDKIALFFAGALEVVEE